jgi:hypothetical protein
VIAGGSHIWPGPRLGSSNPDGRYEASAAIWAFFAGHRAGSLHTPDAHLRSVRAGLAGRKRRLVLTLRVGEPLSLHATLARSGRTAASARASLGQGGAVHVTLAVPGTAAGGRYTLRLLLRDADGRSSTVTRSVLLASAPA